jgi:hypothetical protein
MPAPMMPEVEHPPPEHFHRSGPRPRDLVLPICALFVSVVSLAVAVLHGRALEQMAEGNAKLVQANSWPFLQYVTANHDDTGDLVITLGVHNAGVGPAKIESFEVLWQGQPVRNNLELLERCCGLDPAELTTDKAVSPKGASEVAVAAARNASRSSIANDFMAASEKGVMEAHQQSNFLVLPLTAKTAPVWDKLNAARLQVKTRACYCSVFDECWVSSLRTLDAQQVKTCPTPAVPFAG